MASRLHQRDNRANLFAGYDAHSRTASASPSRPSSNPYQNPYSYSSRPSSSQNQFSAYPSGGAAGNGSLQADGGFRSATPNSKGQYSDATLDAMEQGNDEEIEGMFSRVKMLKSLTNAIGDEIRDSTALAEKMNDSFDLTRGKLRGTMNRMLRMAERTGVGWKVWAGFFAAVILLFWYVWLF